MRAQYFAYHIHIILFKYSQVNTDMHIIYNPRDIYVVSNYMYL